MKLIITALILFCLTASESFSQVIEERGGTVTFVSSQYYYVRFDDTEGMKAGDTLFVREDTNLIPVLRVQFVSSKSSAGILIGNKKLNLNDKLIFFTETNTGEPDLEKKDEINLPVEPVTGEVLQVTNLRNKTDKKKSGLNGRFSVQSYTNLSNYTGFKDYQRWRYTFSLNADRIDGTGLSVSSYVNFNYRADQWNKVTSDIWKNLKIFDLAIIYNFNESAQLTAGRRRSRSISNIGSIDGIQFEQKMGKFYAGAVAGYRPDFTDLSFNSDLFEYGGYIGRRDSLSKGFIENNLAFMQQTNNFKTDRRFLYFQHTNNIIANTYLFASSEIDLYKKIMEEESDEFILTSLFLSLRYSPSKFFSGTISYDTRKNVVYYETYKNFIDSLFENESRQGLNLRTNFRLFNGFSLGLNSGYRFKKKDIKPTRNFGGYLSYANIPEIETSVSLSYNKLFTNFIESSVAGIRVSKNLFSKIDLSLGYRRSEYELTTSAFNSAQNIFSVDLSARFTRSLSFSVVYEGVFENETSAARIFTGITARF